MLSGSKLLFAILSIVIASLSAEASTIKGVISDETGAPIPKASVGLYSADRDWEIHADDAGKFRLEVPSGTYEMEVQFPGFIPKLIRNFKVGAVDPVSIPIVLKVGSCPPCCWTSAACNIADVSYEDSPGKPSIKGQLVSERGRFAPAGVKVSLLKADVDGIIATTQTNTDGGFQFEGLEAGRYNVRFSEGSRNSTAFNVRVRRGKITVLKSALGDDNNFGIVDHLP